jgi:hypothetical protein
MRRQRGGDVMDGTHTNQNRGGNTLPRGGGKKNPGNTKAKRWKGGGMGEADIWPKNWEEAQSELHDKETQGKHTQL